MASLTDQNIKDTYKGLLKTANNGVITSQVEITDGNGNQTGVYLNTDGSLKASGTIEFGSLKDTGENINVAKFVDEADGIGNNDNDTSIPTSAAVKDYVDSNVTAQDLDFVGDSGIGAVDLDSQSLDIAGGTGITTSAADQTLTIDIDSTVATLSDTQTLTNKTIELQNNTVTGTITQFNTALIGNDFATLAKAETLTNKSIDADNNTISNLEVDNLKAGVLDTDLSSVSALDDTLASAKAIKNYVDDKITQEDLDFSGDTGTGSIDLDSEVFSITGSGIATTSVPTDNNLQIDVPATNLSNTPSASTLDVESSTGTNTTLPAATTSLAGVMTGADKTKLDGIESGAEVNDVTSVNTQTGAVVLDADDIDDTATTNKFTTASDISKLAGIEAGAEVNTVDSVNAQTGAVVLDTDDISEGAVNLWYTDARVSANTDVVANTAKVSYPSADATKVGFISVTQAVNLDTMESDIAINNAKVSNVTTNLSTTEAASSVTVNSSDGTDATINGATTSLAGVMTSADKTKLDGIATGATANTGTVTEVTVGAGLDVTNGTTTPEITVDLAELTDMTDGMLTADELVVIDASDLGTKRKQVNEIGLSLFDNNAGFVTTSGFTMNSGAKITMPKSSSGSTAGSEVLFMDHSATFGGSLNLRSEIKNGSFGSYLHFLFTHAGTTAGSIARSGNTSVSYNTSSDYRLKENVTEITDGIDRVKQLKPSKFNFIGEERIVDGFLAHQVQDVVPESIMGEKDAVDEDGKPIYQAIDQSKIVPLLAAALKEAIGKIENLEARIQTLENS